MAIEALNWCRELSGLRGVEKSILNYLCDRFNVSYGYAWPSVGRIALDTGWSKTTILSATRKLEKKGLIQIHSQFYARDGSRASNRYYLPALASPPPKGQVFAVGGSFDQSGIWDPDLD